MGHDENEREPAPEREWTDESPPAGSRKCTGPCAKLFPGFSPLRPCIGCPLLREPEREPAPERAAGLICAFCGQPSEGNYSVHRDGFGLGPEVDLCNGCGEGAHPTLDEIWARIRRAPDVVAGLPGGGVVELFVDGKKGGSDG